MRRRLAFLAVVAALCVAGCTTGTSEVNQPVGNSGGSVSSSGGSSHSTTKAVAHVGATLSLDSGAEQVTLTQVIDPAQPSNQYITPNAGDRFVATVFTIKNVSSKSGTGDANNNASVIGSNNQTYTADFDTVSECTNFDNGEFQLGPGESATGCVVFQLPTSVTVTKVHWTPDSGFASDFGEWLVP
jgi:Domain of unknown function (DUF4352)